MVSDQKKVVCPLQVGGEVRPPVQGGVPSMREVRASAEAAAPATQFRIKREKMKCHPENILGRALKSRAYFAAIEQNHSDDSDWITEWGANGPLAELTWILGERRVG
ncbi:hypothetical protein D4764_02G0003660 [Takifugu flavidus]|uniref:Uncharacterized protein n=1 Tax=Takifugu flavidus TaxID=433684 RepID=A0A5C6NK55_9TELE|nr:hypothetical protein D4764_02G0003660 [Takifugu flavidus]